MRDLFLWEFHIIFVRRDMRASDIHGGTDAKQMREFALAKMRKANRANPENPVYAYCEICQRTPERVISLERIYFNDKAVV